MASIESRVTARVAMQWRADARPYFEHLRRDAAFHAFVAVYALVPPLIGMVVGAEHKAMPLSFFLDAARSLGLLLGLLIAGTGLWALRSSNPFKAWRVKLLQVCTPSTISGGLLFVSLLTAIVVFSSIKQTLPAIVPFFADVHLADLDRTLHGQDPWRLTSAAMPLQLMPALEGLYLGPWGLILMGATIAVLFSPALRHVRAKYVWTLLIMWPLLGNLLAGALMSAGPVFYEQVTGDARFAGLVSYLARHSGQEWVQNFLWNAYANASTGVMGAGISAFPSMHVASATLVALLTAQASYRWVRWAGVAYCAVILFGSVHLGWHYAVDGYFSIGATILIWKIVGCVFKDEPLAQHSIES